jgi:hypothetical protein
MNRFLLGPATWAYAIIVGGALLITPDGIDPIVYRALGAVGVLLGLAAFALSRRAAPARVG